MGSPKGNKKLTNKFDTRCPECDSRDSVGFLGGSASKKYFCGDCCIEFLIKAGVVKVFWIDSNGTIEQ